ncbi:MAG: hypothetical protein KGJ07_00095 [Patescibacteria group bacterium]|nr:hypothetical protein [Patescibacteria group bacterium]
MTKKYVVKPRLTDKGFPTHSKFYNSAHEEASKAEKAKFPTGYNHLKDMDRRVSKHELLGKNLKSGKIEVSQKVPPKYRREVAFHEQVENKAIKRMQRNKKK